MRIGTSKVKEHYNLGTKTTDVMLEILNLNKKEVIPINGISNEEFSQVRIYSNNCFSSVSGFLDHMTNSVVAVGVYFTVQ